MFRLDAWGLIARFAWRDLRSSRAKAVFLIATIAISIGSVAGVHSSAAGARGALLMDSRVWLGGDISVTTGDPLDEDQIRALDHLRASGADWTLVTWVTTAATSDQAPDPALVTVKIVDPAAYPYYGAIELKPASRLLAALTPDSVAVSDDLLSRLQVRMGDPIRIGGEVFRITALIQAEPDRFTGSLGLGPRCILSTRAFERIQAARAGEPGKYRVLLRLPHGASLEAARRQLREIVPEGTVLGYREANRHAIQSVDQATMYLEITAALTLVLGAISILFTIQEHLNARLDTFAILKALGAAGSQIFAIFALETGGLLALGYSAALPIVWIVRKTVLAIAGSYFVMLPGPVFNIRLLGYIAIAGVAAVSPALLEVMFQVRQLRPALLLRRGTGEVTAEEIRTRSIAALVLLIVFGALFISTFDAWRPALLLLAAIAAILMALVGAARLSLRILQRGSAEGMPLSQFRLAIRSIFRPANRSLAVITALAFGFMVMAATFMLKSAISNVILNAFPLDQTNLLILGVAGTHQEEVRGFLAAQAGIEGPVNVITLAKLQLSTVDGVPVESLGDQAQGDAFVNLVGCDSNQPPGQVAVAADVALLIRARRGSLLKFVGRRGTITASVNAVPNLTGAEKFWRTFVMNCNSLNESEEFHQIAARIDPQHVAAVERQLAANYPTLPNLTGDEVSATIDSVSRDTIGLIRSVAWYAIISAAVLMIAVVSASRAHRLREIGVLSALGASRRVLVKLYTLEFAVIGAVSGLLGGLAACALEWMVLTAALHRRSTLFPFAIIPLTILASVAVSIVAGWLPCYRLLSQKPLAILRRE